MALSLDRKLLASGGRNKAVVIWNVGTQKELHALKPDHAVNALAYSLTGDRLFATDVSAKLIVWCAKTGKKLKVFDREMGSGVMSMAHSPDGKVLALGRMDATLLVIREPVAGEKAVRVQDRLRRGRTAGDQGLHLLPERLRPGVLEDSDCDGSGSLAIDDFTCFQNEFASGCPN